MSTLVRPELSTKSRYWIEKHRYYELKHFCLQYPIWKKAHAALDSMSRANLEQNRISKTNLICDPTVKCAEARLFYAERMSMIEKIAKEADPGLSTYILTAVTEGISYDCLRTRLGMPCCKGSYYNLYRRFFWLLNRERQ